FGDDEERTIARAVVAGGPLQEEEHTPLAPTTLSDQVVLATPDLRCEAENERHRIVTARSLTRLEEHGTSAPSSRRESGVEPDALDRAHLLLEADGAWVCRARRSTTRAALGRRILLLWRVSCEDGLGRVVESSLVGTETRLATALEARDRETLPHLLA